jgi:uncharacterized Zn-binding protein involved in type VI secretion
MSKNVKRIFFAVTLLTLLVAVSAVSANGVSDDTPIADSLQDNVVSDVTQTTSDDAVVAEQVSVTSSDNNVETTKNLEKEDKNLKKESITIDGITYTNIIENQEINENFQIRENTYINNSTFNKECNLYATNVFINNSVFNGFLSCDSGTVIFKNSQLNDGLWNMGAKIYVDDSNIIGNDFYIDEISMYGPGMIYSNNTALKESAQEVGIEVYELPYVGSMIFENTTITGEKTISSTGNITFINCILNAKITNEGNITLINSTLSSGNIYNNGFIIINDDCNIKDGYMISLDGNIIVNDTLAVYLYFIEGNHTFENKLINTAKLNVGNVTFINSTLNSTLNNEGNLFVYNCTLNSTIINMGMVVIADDVIFGEGFMYKGKYNGQLIMNNTKAVLTINNSILTVGKTTTLKVNVKTRQGENINNGKVTFKINGKTIKDSTGKVIYAKVVDGIASIEYTVPNNLAGKNINITAVYSGSSEYDKETTTLTTTVPTPDTTLTITPFTEPVTTGSTITLKAKVTLGDTPITTGKIVFKINGKTVKDANGKVIYAKVDANGEVSVDYNLGDLKANIYTVEAVFTATGYDKIQSNTTVTVVKA